MAPQRRRRRYRGLSLIERLDNDIPQPWIGNCNRNTLAHNILELIEVSQLCSKHKATNQARHIIQELALPLCAVHQTVAHGLDPRDMLQHVHLLISSWLNTTLMEAPQKVCNRLQALGAELHLWHLCNLKS